LKGLTILLPIVPHSGQTIAYGQFPDASAGSLARSAVAGWEIDEALLTAAGGSATQPVVVGPGDALRLQPILKLAAQAAEPRIDPLRCFTVAFWRRVRPDLLPFFAYSNGETIDCGPFLPKNLSSMLWRFSVLAALDGLAEGPVIIGTSLSEQSIEAARDAEPVELSRGAMLSQTSSLEETLAVLGQLTGRHEHFPRLVAPGALEAMSALVHDERPADIAGAMKIYWKDSADKFDEDRSTEIRVVLGAQIQRVRIPVPAASGDAVRLDPIDRACHLHFRAIRLTSTDGALRSYPVGASLLQQHPHSGMSVAPDDPRVLVASDSDPHVILSLPPRVASRQETYLELEMAARSGPEVDQLPDNDWSTEVDTEPGAQAGALPDLVCDLSSWVGSGFHDEGHWSQAEHRDPMLTSSLLTEPVGGQAILQMAVIASQGVTGTLYFAGEDGNFSEDRAIAFEVNTDGEVHRYTLNVPDHIGSLPRSRVRYVRVDPVDDVARFRLRSLEFRRHQGDVPTDVGKTHQPTIDTVIHRPVIVSLARTDYHSAMGGTERRIADEAAYAAEQGFSFLHVYPQTKSVSFGGLPPSLLNVRTDGQPPVNLTAADLAATIRRLSVVEFRVHHVMGWSWNDIGSVLTAHSAPVRYYAHDYFAICPEYRLLRNHRSYCGAPPVESTSCQVCTRRPDRLRTRPRIEALLDAVAHRLTIHSPSQVAAELYAREFPHLADRIEVHPHEQLVALEPPPPTQLPSRLRLAFVGIADDSKGWATWKRLCANPLICDRYELLHLGLNGTHTTDRQVRVDFRISGADAMEQTLRAEDVHLALIWSSWPETFSFVTVEAIAAGCAVLTSQASGNVGRLIDEYGSGVALSDEEALIDLLSSDRTTHDLVRGARQAAWARKLNTEPLHLRTSTGLAT
jgi:hypothetical protein